MNQKKAVRVIAVVMAVMLVLSLLVSILPRSYADGDFDSQLASLNSEKDSARERRISAQNKVQALKEEQAAVIEEKLALEERNEACIEEIGLIQEQISLITAEIKLYDDKIARKEEDVRVAAEKENYQLQKYRTRLRAMEENGNYNILSLILNSDNSMISFRKPGPSIRLWNRNTEYIKPSVKTKRLSMRVRNPALKLIRRNWSPRLRNPKR